MIHPDDAAASFAQHRRRVEAAAARVLRDPHEAADVASDAFLTLLERGPEDERVILPWLLTTARNRALNTVRGRRRSMARLRVMADRPEEARSPAADRQVAAFVGALLARLQPRDRDALVARYQHESSYEEIASDLGTTVAQARVIVHRAVGRLRRQAVTLLAEQHGAAEDCVRALARNAEIARLRPHAGCGPCAAVLDEVSALGAPALIAASPGLLQALAERVSRAATKMRPPRAPVLERVAEAMTALALAGAMGLGGGTAAAVPPPSVPITAGASASSIDADRLSTAPTRPPRDPGPRAVGVLGIDEGDDPVLARTPRHPLLGRLRSVLDALEARDAPSDLRRFEVASLVASDGEPLGLRFRLRVAGPITEDMSFAISWVHDPDPCWASIEVAQAGTSFTTTCSNPSWLDHPLMPSSWTYQGVVRRAIEGDTLTLTVWFDEQSPELTSKLGRGAVLRNLMAQSCCRRQAEGTISHWDQAPDDGRDLSYRIR